MAHVLMVSIVPREAVRWHLAVLIIPMVLARMSWRLVGLANVRASVVQMSPILMATVPRWSVTSPKTSVLPHLVRLLIQPERVRSGRRVAVTVW